MVDNTYLLFVGKAIKKHGRDKFFIVSKFGPIRDATGRLVGYDCSPAHTRKQLEETLARLGAISLQFSSM